MFIKIEYASKLCAFLGNSELIAYVRKLSYYLLKQNEIFPLISYCTCVITIVALSNYLLSLNCHIGCWHAFLMKL